MELDNDELKYGQIVWICDYRHNDIFKKPIRNIKPIKVMVIDNEKLPKNKRVYYSETHFRKLNKKGEANSTVIVPFDNTGYRGYTGKCVDIFDNEIECIKCYLKQCAEIMKMIENGRKESNERFNNMIKEVSENAGNMAKGDC